MLWTSIKIIARTDFKLECEHNLAEKGFLKVENEGPNNWKFSQILGMINDKV